MADDTSARPDPTLSDDPTPPAAGDGETRSPSWLERMEARRADPPESARDDLPVRPVFVSFIIEAARYLSGASDIAKTYTAGATLPLALVGTTSGQVVDPDGNTVLSLADTTREQQIKLNNPGFYEVYTPQWETVVAANIDPRESDLGKISQEVLDRWQGAAAGEIPAAATDFTAEDTETMELWHWLLLFLAIIVIGESILGNMHLAPRRLERA